MKIFKNLKINLIVKKSMMRMMMSSTCSMAKSSKKSKLKEKRETSLWMNMETSIIHKEILLEQPMLTLLRAKVARKKVGMQAQGMSNL